MPAGTLFGAIQAFQQSSDWMAKQRQQQQMQHALRALGEMYGQPQQAPQGPMGAPDPGMTADQSAGAQTARDAAQTVGWPQGGTGGPTPPNASPASPVANPSAVLNDPATMAKLQAMMGGGQAPPAGGQGPQMPVPSAPSMAQPREPMKQPPVPGMSSTAQPDAAGMDDPFKAATQSIQTIAQGIKAANPNIDPMTLAMAVQSQIENIKGVAPLTKAAMSGQLGAMKLQIQAQEMAAKVQHWNDWYVIARRNAQTKKEIAAVDEKYKNGMLELGQARIDASIGNNERTNATRITTTGMRDATQVTTTGMRDDTSRANNADTNARQDRGTTQRQGASDATTYRTTYGNYLRQHPKDVVGATRAARAAVSDVQRGTPRSDIPSGDPLAGGGAPAPRGGSGGPKPSAQDMAYLKQHKSDPAVVAAFKKHFGAAAAQAAMR